MTTEQTTTEPRLKQIFNLGVKAPDVAAESTFFAAFNPDRTFYMDRSRSASGPKKVPAVEFNGVKFFFFSSLAYDADLSEPHPGGISHVAFMVDDLDELVAHLSRQGIEPFKGPYSVDIGELGRRKVVFYRSPNGTILEPQELLK
ncbi:VOC family protein [Aminobacter anthyllidis]|uniref:VOC family protein n=1 Tax=Aminobacter anthyllidis TaxID=1035067 RepID=A0A9X1AC78_9HYPH|nr:VOC family protein [Aminobacter anthyllidis]MBT1157163.1 VOC family protein [Aminobacter anthyllidis]